MTRLPYSQPQPAPNLAPSAPKPSRSSLAETAPDRLQPDRQNPERTSPGIHRKTNLTGYGQRPTIPPLVFTDAAGNPITLPTRTSTVTLDDQDHHMNSPERSDDQPPPPQKTVFYWPTKADFLKKGPEKRHLNPAKTLAAYEVPDPTGPADLQRERTYAPNRGEYQTAVVAYKDMMENGEEAVIDMVDQAPGDFLFCIVFLGGWLLFNSYKSVSAVILKVKQYLTRAGIIGPDDVRFIPLTSQDQSPYAGAYTPPFAFIVQTKNVAVRKILLGVNVFPFVDDPDHLTVRFVEVNRTIMSWCMCLFTPQMEGDDEEYANIIRGGIYDFARTNTAFRIVFERVTGVYDKTDIDERIYAWLKTVDPRYNPGGIWAVHAFPVSEKLEDWEEVCAFFCVIRIVGALNSFNPTTKARQPVLGQKPIAMQQRLPEEIEPPWCNICSNSDHLNWCCFFLRVRDWAGPTMLINQIKSGVFAKAELPEGSGPRQNAHRRGRKLIRAPPKSNAAKSKSRTKSRGNGRRNPY
ncbi:hypothetical protein MKEN_00703100 [Mycena kentingensis (nom. inval.)]|nr:hypothetical protein MKEN_00703100 [Mycena kentingensis (nom. inval.)]